MRFLRLLMLPLVAVLLVASGGCMSSKKKKDYDVAVVRFMLEAKAQEYGTLMRLPTSGSVVSVVPKSHFTEYDIERCEVADNEFGKCLVFQFTADAKRDLYRFSVPNQGLRMVTVLNGAPIGARRIDSPLSDGFFLTYVELPGLDLTKLAKDITRTSEEARKELEKQKK